MGWAKAYHFYSLQSEDRGLAVSAFIRSCDGGNLRCVAVTASDRSESDATRELSLIGSVTAAVCDSASAVSICGGSHILAGSYVENVGSGFKQKVLDYPIFDLRLSNQCLQKMGLTAFGSLDFFSMTEFIDNCLKGAEHLDWMMPRSSPRRAILTNELQM